jgi:hypothetical protein
MRRRQEGETSKPTEKSEKGHQSLEILKGGKYKIDFVGRLTDATAPKLFDGLDVPKGATVENLDLYDNPSLTSKGLRAVLEGLRARQLKVRRLKMYNTAIDDDALVALTAWAKSSGSRPAEIHFSDCAAVTDVGLRAVVELAKDGKFLWVNCGRCSTSQAAVNELVSKFGACLAKKEPVCSPKCCMKGGKTLHLAMPERAGRNRRRDRAQTCEPVVSAAAEKPSLEKPTELLRRVLTEPSSTPATTSTAATSADSEDSASMATAEDEFSVEEGPADAAEEDYAAAFLDSGTGMGSAPAVDSSPVLGSAPAPVPDSNPWSPVNGQMQAMPPMYPAQAEAEPTHPMEPVQPMPPMRPLMENLQTMQTMQQHVQFVQVLVPVPLEQVQQMQSMQGMQGMPGMPGMPQMQPGMPGMPQMLQQMQSMQFVQPMPMMPPMHVMPPMDEHGMSPSHMDPMHAMQIDPMQLHQMAPPFQPTQYGYEGCSPEAVQLLPPPPPPPVCMDMGDGLEEEKFEKADEAPVERPQASREPEPEYSDSNSRSEDEAILLSFGAEGRKSPEPAQSAETIAPESEEDGSKSGTAPSREPSPELLRSSEWRISKGRKGSVPDRFRTGGETAAPPKEKTEAKAAAPTAEKTKVAPALAAEKSEETASAPAPKVVVYPWKRGKRDVVIETSEVQVLEEPVCPEEEFENLPVADLLGWLESHAPKDFLEVHLRQICEEVELMEA